MNDFIPLEGRAQTELINARQLFTAYLQARQEAVRYRSRLAWEARASGEYLVSVIHRNGIKSKKSLGPRSPQTEEIFERHQQRGKETQDRLKTLQAEYVQRTRMSRALGIGQTPPVVVSVLDRIWAAGLIDKILVVGTNAIYGYAAQAGVHISDDVVATLDLDLLWDSRTRMTLASPDPRGLLGLIQQADPSFRRDPEQIYTLTNGSGYQVDLIKRAKDQEPGQLWASEEDFWAVKVNNMDWLLSAPRVKLPVVGQDGRMALMHTVDPRAFALFKIWMSKQNDRDPIKARRDRKQAIATLDLLREYLPIYPLQDIERLGALPQSVRDEGVQLMRPRPA